ncbi:MAG: hypothetical protein IJ794_19545 [Lachnospiraceae bacterium]|nr:hypothetical protein [Lachnospiraceae bacterium]
MTEGEKKYQEVLAWLAAEPLMKNMNGDEMEPMVWYNRLLDGYVNAGGSEDWMYLKRGTTDNLVIFFVGGGFAFNAEMAAGRATIKDFFCPPEKPHFFTDEAHPNNEYYFMEVLGNRGLFALDEENRFADWNIAMINYGTGDIHIGDTDYEYMDERGNKITLHHHGYRNFLAAMEVILHLFPSPEKLLITGVSAGGFGVSALAADIVERYPDCKNITVCADSSYLRHPAWPEIVKKIWKAPDHIAEAAVSDNVVLDMFRMTQKRIGNRAKYLFMIGFPDGVLSIFQNYVDSGQFVPSEEAEKRFAELLKEHISGLKHLDIPFSIYLHSFMQNGMIQHCTLDAPTFRKGELSPMDWIWNAVNGKCEDYRLELIDV